MVEREEDILKVVKIYRRRWLIEDYHKALKTGFRIEDNQLKHANRILALLGMIGLMAARLLKIREFCRLSPMASVKKNPRTLCASSRKISNSKGFLAFSSTYGRLYRTKNQTESRDGKQFGKAIRDYKTC